LHIRHLPPPSRGFCAPRRETESKLTRKIILQPQVWKFSTRLRARLANPSPALHNSEISPLYDSAHDRCRQKQTSHMGFFA